MRSCLYSVLGVSTLALQPSQRVSGSVNPTQMVLYLFSHFSCKKNSNLTSICIDASPGYFAQTLDNNIKMEATATRRAGLERFTFPAGSKPYFVLDLANDLPNSFAGGEMNIDPEKGRITLGGKWGSRYG